MSTDRPYPAVIADPHVDLELDFIAQYLKEHAPGGKDRRRQSPAALRQLMIEASRFASCRLAEMELRARLVNSVHGVVGPGELG